MDQKNLADLYGLDPVPWSRALKALESDRRQRHVVPCHHATRRAPARRRRRRRLGQRQGLRRERPGTRKSQNLAQNPNCAVGISKPGIDLVIEGTAARVIDDETPTTRKARRRGLARVRREWRVHHEYSAPSAGPPPWNLYAITPTTIFGVLGDQPGGANALALRRLIDRRPVTPPSSPGNYDGRHGIYRPRRSTPDPRR